MTPRNVIRFVGGAVCAPGIVLLVATGSVASGLGAGAGDAVPGSVDSASLAFFQLAFMRLFATALIGLGAILLWCHSHLSDAQAGSLLKILSIVLGGLALMALGQQIAIWNSGAGWVLAGALLLTAAVCTVTTVRDATRGAV
jgi:hypothetical protein